LGVLELAPQTGREVMTAHDPHAAILAFRDAANADPDFVRYKILVGYQSVFAHAWDDPATAFEEREEWRAAEIDKLVAEVDDENADDWLSLIRRCAATKSNDLATFPSFTQFLEKLGKRKPDFALRCLREASDDISKFLAAALRGLSKMPDWPEALGVVTAWVEQSRHLGEVIFTGGAIPELPIDLMAHAVDLSLAANDVGAVWHVPEATMRRYNPDLPAEAEGLKTLFLQSARFLAAHDGHRALVPWVILGKPLIFDLFTRAERREYLNLLIPFETWGIYLERTVVAAAGNEPDLMLEFLASRAEFRQGTNSGSYDALPYEIEEIKGLLAPHVGLVLDTTQAWFKKDDWLWEHFAARLVVAIYPGIGDILEPELRKLISSEDRDAIEFVVAILREYNGELPILVLCREVVAILPEGDELLSSVRIAITSTGVVTGEYGMAEAYRKRHREVATWSTDERPSVKVFVTAMLHELDNEIASETRRADASIAQRKLDFEAHRT
jgi:hypothetical protein